MRHYSHTALGHPAGLCLAGFAALGMLYVYGYGIERFRPEIIGDTLASLGYWGPCLYILGNAVRPFFFFPAIVLGVAGGFAFGPLWGAVYLVIGTVLGATLCFAAARLLGRDRLRRACPWLPAAVLDHQAFSGFKAIMLLRLAPVLPWDAVSFLAGLAGVSFRPYLGATLLGSIPGAVAFTCLGGALAGSLYTAAVVAALLAAAGLYLRSRRRGI
ncbi:TVP38/TMEM64 family protein [Anaeroselena agilis]|uniref:TVP38/TMEM64 family membrane protein n=1 Tax=Anaeroselena agilis TaxID=3063788 RepID=A0ABU3P4L2_9FIRM|nr:VTT domain-containing protein [Selenomonadales bacterium 4137-cl]